MSILKIPKLRNNCLKLIVNNKQEEINIIKDFVNNHNLEFDICESYLKGSDGSLSVALKVIDLSNNNHINYLYNSLGNNCRRQLWNIF